MRGEGDFSKVEDIVEEARVAYSEIYYWHKGLGERRFKERFGGEFSPSLHAQYVALVAVMVAPPEASSDEMLKVAHEVLSGRMEWAYSEKSERGVTLSNWARRIKELLHHYREQTERARTIEQLRSIRNIGGEGQVADGHRVEIPVQGDEGWNIGTYLEYAKVAYRDVPETDSIGGSVFLADTNLEISSGRKEQYVFHNATLLHVHTVVERHSLAQLVSRRGLSVEAVILEA
jgi:hypothetical protein